MNASNLSMVQARSYGDDLPASKDVLLTIEAADTSLARDRDIKLPIYATAGIVESCLVNLRDKTIERHSDPAEFVCTKPYA